MAITKLTAPLDGLRGTIGAITYSANKSGTYAKPWSPPSQPRTTNQQDQRSYIALWGPQWSALTAAQRAAWDTYAALPAQELTNSLGDAYYISGFAWFVSCNTRLTRIARSTITSPPTNPQPAAPASCAITIVPAGTDTDLCTGGTPIKSTEQPGYPATNAFDDNTTTYWLTTTGSTTGYIGYSWASAKIVRHYRFWVQNTAWPELPNTWTFDGWDGGAWVPLHTVTLWAVTSTGWHSFYFDNSTAYTQYRMNVTAIKGPGGNNVLCSELEMYQGNVGTSRITYPQGTFTLIAYDLVCNISMTISTARIVQYPGYYEVLTTQSPGRFYTLFTNRLTDVFGPIQSARRWFAQIYRQTSEGRRSAPASANSITLE